ncbi:hypothetical protein AALP_AA1G233900 [Arabis alpina]|uniref:Uncharacterized protein n=1 Tax=Arabis alpina TaxID=50452 RepID=A0A087HQ45_ARAAL|nr:hypothetical protein AALP_AA1G233900 [Arabis alpina]
MAHSLGPLSPAAQVARLSSPSPPSRSQTPPVVLQIPPINRRTIVLGLGSALWSWKAFNGNEEAMAAARRAPPPPATEKKDPNVTGLQAKILANKKRKEAMKESIAKLREKGKPVVEEEAKVIEKGKPVVVEEPKLVEESKPVVVEEEPSSSSSE